MNDYVSCLIGFLIFTLCWRLNPVELEQCWCEVDSISALWALRVSWAGLLIRPRSGRIVVRWLWLGTADGGSDTLYQCVISSRFPLVGSSARLFLWKHALLHNILLLQLSSRWVFGGCSSTRRALRWKWKVVQRLISVYPGSRKNRSRNKRQGDPPNPFRQSKDRGWLFQLNRKGSVSPPPNGRFRDLDCSGMRQWQQIEHPVVSSLLHT